MAQIFNIGRDKAIRKRKQQDKHLPVKIVSINTQKYKDIIVKGVWDQEKKNNLDRDIEEEDIMQTWEIGSLTKEQPNKRPN